MQIQISTDSNIGGRGESTTEFRRVVEDALGRFSDHITRVDRWRAISKGAGSAYDRTRQKDGLGPDR